jgi:hypothetical protein
VAVRLLLGVGEEFGWQRRLSLRRCWLPRFSAPPPPSDLSSISTALNSAPSVCSGQASYSGAHSHASGSAGAWPTCWRPFNVLRREKLDATSGSVVVDKHGERDASTIQHVELATLAYIH